MQSIKRLVTNRFLYGNEKPQIALLAYLFILFCFVGLFICEIDPVIGNDILIIGEGIFIYRYFYVYFQSNDAGAYVKELFENKIDINKTSLNIFPC